MGARALPSRVRHPIAHPPHERPRRGSDEEFGRKVKFLAPYGITPRGLLVDEVLRGARVLASVGSIDPARVEDLVREARPAYERPGEPELLAVHSPDGCHAYRVEYFERMAAWLGAHL